MFGFLWALIMFFMRLMLAGFAGLFALALYGWHYAFEPYCDHQRWHK